MHCRLANEHPQHRQNERCFAKWPLMESPEILMTVLGRACVHTCTISVCAVDKYSNRRNWVTTNVLCTKYYPRELGVAVVDYVLYALLSLFWRLRH